MKTDNEIGSREVGMARTFDVPRVNDKPDTDVLSDHSSQLTLALYNKAPVGVHSVHHVIPSDDCCCSRFFQNEVVSCSL